MTAVGETVAVNVMLVPVVVAVLEAASVVVVEVVLDEVTVTETALEVLLA